MLWSTFPSKDVFVTISLIFAISDESKYFAKILKFLSVNTPNIADPLTPIDVILLVKSYCIIFVASS